MIRVHDMHGNSLVHDSDQYSARLTLAQRLSRLCVKLSEPLSIILSCLLHEVY